MSERPETRSVTWLRAALYPQVDLSPRAVRVRLAKTPPSTLAMQHPAPGAVSTKPGRGRPAPPRLSETWPAWSDLNCPFIEAISPALLGSASSVTPISLNCHGWQAFRPDPPSAVQLMAPSRRLAWGLWPSDWQRPLPGGSARAARY